MVLHHAGESIECEKCELTTRKIVPSSPMNINNIGRVIKYECSRNSSTEILKELDPKVFKYKFSSKLDLGVKLQSESLYLITNQIKRIKLDVVNETSTHKANKGTINAYTFAEIKYPLANVINAIKKKKELK